MRRLLLTVFVLGTVSCGGGGDNGPTTPPSGNPPPVTNGTPATIMVQSGDGQQAEPGTNVSVNPVVAVKNAAGLGVAGITVGFVVDSGGGSLQNSSAVTASDGTASPGDWRLGASEGRNILKVTAGTLAPLQIAATAIVSGGTFPLTTLASSGGAVLVRRPGPLNGFSLNVPAGSFTMSTAWTISYRSASTIAKTAVLNPVSPVIHLTGTASSYSAKLLTLTIPATIAANTFPVIVLRDPSTGLIEALPTIGYDSVSVTAVTRHLNAAFLLKNSATRSGGLVGSAAIRTGGYDVEVVVSTLTRAQLDADIDTGFRPGVDDWGFENPGTYFQPEGICQGMTLSAMWYFANKKADGNLFHRLDRALGVPLSNRGGIRWSSKVNAAQPLGDMEKAFEAATESAKNSPGVSAGQIRYDMIKAQLLITQLPQLVVVAGNDIAHAVMAYRTAGLNTFVTDPNVPGGLNQTVRFGISEFVPYYMASTTGAGPRVPLRYVAGIGASALYDWGKFPDEYAQAVDGTIDEAVFPVTEMRSRFGVLSDTIYVADTMATWIQCAACQSFPAPPGLTGTSGPLAQLELFRNLGGNLAWSPRGTALVNLLNPSTFPNPGDFRYGYVITGNGTDGDLWIDWKTFIVRKLQGSITPAAPADIVGNPIALAMNVTPNKLPANVIYKWAFADGDATVSVNNNNTVQHAFQRAGAYAITAQILDGNTQQPIAKASASVTVESPQVYWRFTSATTTISSVQEQLLGYDGRWKVDSTILARMANGGSQGGIRFVSEAFTPTGAPLRTAPIGLYLLEGASINLTTLGDPLTLNTFSLTTFPNAPLSLPAAPQVSGWNLVQQAAPVNAFCNGAEDAYVLDGTITNGHLTGLRVPLCVQSTQQNVNGRRLMSMDADVTFGATSATGTISVIYYFYGNGSPANFFQRTARLTFSATRVTQ